MNDNKTPETATSRTTIKAKTTVTVLVGLTRQHPQKWVRFSFLPVLFANRRTLKTPAHEIFFVGLFDMTCA